LFLAQFCDALVGISLGAALFLIAVKVLEVSAYKKRATVGHFVYGAWAESDLLE
jgi:hypothetical protein